MQEIEFSGFVKHIALNVSILFLVLSTYLVLKQLFELISVFPMDLFPIYLCLINIFDARKHLVVYTFKD